MAYRDHYAIRTPTNFGKGHKTRRYHNFLSEALPYLNQQNCSVLDIKAGHGEFAEGCVNKNFEFCGIESNDLMCNDLKRMGYNVVKTLIPPIPLSKNQFDLIFSCYVLESINTPKEQYELLLECNRVLKPGGIILIVSRNYMRQGKYMYEDSYTITNPTTERRIHQLFFDTGFHLEKTRFVAGNLFGPLKIFAYLFYAIYHFSFWEKLFGYHNRLNSIFYKLRVSFPESIIMIGRKGG